MSSDPAQMMLHQRCHHKQCSASRKRTRKACCGDLLLLESEDLAVSTSTWVLAKGGNASAVEHDWLARPCLIHAAAAVMCLQQGSADQHGHMLVVVSQHFLYLQHSHGSVIFFQFVLHNGARHAKSLLTQCHFVKRRWRTLFRCNGRQPAFARRQGRCSSACSCCFHFTPWPKRFWQ